MELSRLVDDLVAEQVALDAVVAELPAESWSTATPSPRWSVADQIGHLTYFDGTAAMAISEPEAFAAHREGAFRRYADPADGDELTLGEFRRLAAAQQLSAWRDARDRLEAAARTLADGQRVEWYGPAMSAKSFVTARLMEVWAHGQDVVDAVGAERADTDRLAHVAQLGVITRGWSYLVRGEQPPSDPVRVELTAPSGAVWSWGPGDAAASVVGPAGDFCRVVTQRRHVADTALVVTGEVAHDWMAKAQAFAGTPTSGPPPLRPG